MYYFVITVKVRRVRLGNALMPTLRVFKPPCPCAILIYPGLRHACVGWMRCPLARSAMLGESADHDKKTLPFQLLSAALKNIPIRLVITVRFVEIRGRARSTPLHALPRRIPIRTDSNCNLRIIKTRRVPGMLTFLRKTAASNGERTRERKQYASLRAALASMARSNLNVSLTCGNMTVSNRRGRRASRGHGLRCRL